jgi:hypothetical protein
MKFAMIVFALCLAGCSSSKSKWVLQSYDQAKGYTFVKDGITYEANCWAVGKPMLGVNQDIPDTNPDSEPSTPVYGHEEDCYVVLDFLHKPMPSNFYRFGDKFQLIQPDNYRIVFAIKRAH